MKKIIILLAMSALTGMASEQNQHIKALEIATLSETERLERYELHKKMLGNQEISKELRDWSEEIAFAMGDHTGKVKKLPIHKMSAHNLLNKDDLAQGTITINAGRQTATGIWLNTVLLDEDEIKYVATHELAHWILEHHYKKQYPYQKEFEADQLALSTLHKMNKMDTILTELINRNFIGYNYNIRHCFDFSDHKEFKIFYPTEKERASYYKKIIENLPNKKTNLPKNVVQKNRKLLAKQFCKPNILGNIGCAALFLCNSYYCAQEALKADKKIKKETIKKQLDIAHETPTCDNLIPLYAQSKRIATISSGLMAGSATLFLYPLVKTSRAALLFKKKGLI
ncbi:MAG: hypothetical protein ACOYT8_05365 [Candidatus Dependentiae bacterium]